MSVICPTVGVRVNGSALTRSHRVVIIGAGLGGLAAALRLAGAGRDVTVLERAAGPGGLMGQWEAGGYRIDTGPTVLTMPDLIADAFHSVGESLSDWLTLLPVVPSYRACFADGSVLRSYADTEQMTEEVANVCGTRQAKEYRELHTFLESLYRAEFDTFMDRNLDGLGELVRPQALTLLRLGALRSLDHVIGQYLSDDRLRRLFTFQALYAGLSPTRARAIYAIISYLDSVAGVFHPLGGMYAVAQALSDAARKHGVDIRYGTTANHIELDGDTARAVTCTDGQRFVADAVIVNAELTGAYGTLLPNRLRPWRLRRPALAPSAFVFYAGSDRQLSTPAHHTISFGQQWQQTFDEICHTGKLMSDPSILVTSATVTDPSTAPPGKHTYYVLAPCPNLDRADLDWTHIAPRYRDELVATLQARGLDDGGALTTGVQLSQWRSPADWAAAGMPAGTPFGLSHVARQTGPFRHPTKHPGLSNVLFCGAGTQPGIGVPTSLISGKLAAQRILTG